METSTKRLYEAMFLVDSAEAAADWDGIIETITTILDRAEAEMVSIRKWDECKLAYDINKKSRGTYILCYLRAEGGKIAGMERDVQLNERIMRVLILNAEHMSDEDVAAETPALRAERRIKEAAEAAEKAAAEAIEKAAAAAAEKAAEPEEAVEEKAAEPEEAVEEKTEESDEAVVADAVEATEDVEPAAETEDAESAGENVE